MNEILFPYYNNQRATNIIQRYEANKDFASKGDKFQPIIFLLIELYFLRRLSTNAVLKSIFPCFFSVEYLIGKKSVGKKFRRQKFSSVKNIRHLDKNLSLFTNELFYQAINETHKNTLISAVFLY